MWPRSGGPERPEWVVGYLAMHLRPFAIAALVIALATVLVVTSLGIGSMAAMESGSGGVALSGATVSASLVVGPSSKATPISSAFWGVDVVATHRFDSTDAANVAATPVTYVVFPGGTLGEQFNYTSGIITGPHGLQQPAVTSASEFVASCKLFDCNAILQLPAEIDQPATAASFASYVVHTLKYQPAYWQIGNDPAGWKHFDVPWSDWKKYGGNTTPLPYANEVHTYIEAVLAVDPAAKFLALGAMGGAQNHGKPWVEELASVDGHLLSGISVHSYVQGGPSHPTDAELFANLNGPYSLSVQIPAVRSYIQDACPSCTDLKVFATETNAAEDSPYIRLLPTFAGTLYLAVDTIQGLANQVTNLDWFAYASGYPGAWSDHAGQWQMQYYLFSDIATHLGSETLPTTLTGPSTLYGMATYDKSGLALFLVNVNATSAVNLNMAQSGFKLGYSGVTEYLWQEGSNLPSKSSVTLSSTLNVPSLSMVLLTVGPAGE